MRSLVDIRILVVEDEALIAAEIQDRLQKMGAHVLGVVDTADRAIAFTAESPPDLILMDIRLKGGRDGIEAAADIYSRLGIPSVFLTAYSDRATVERVLAVGQFGYLTKPFREDDLSAAIQLALQHHRIEAGLRESHLSLSQILGNATDGLLAADRDERVRYANRAAEELLATDAGSLLNRRVDAIIDLRHEQSGTPLDHFVTAVINDRAPPIRDQPFLLTRPDGTVDPIEVSIAAIPDGDRIIGAAISLRSLVERRRSDAERARSERALNDQRLLLGTLIDGLPELFFAIDRDENLVVANHALLERLGKKRYEVIGRPLADIFSGDEFVDVCSQTRSAMRTGNRITFQRRAWTGLDGTLRWFSFSYIPLSSDGDIVLACTAIDVTERRQLEDELIEATSREQRRLSRNLHDTLGQELAALGLLIARIERKVARIVPDMLPDFAEIKELVANAFESIRATARGLAPTELHNGGLVSALHSLAASYGRGRIPHCYFLASDDALPQIDDGVAEHIFRFAQEATSNAARHANCRTITIKLALLGNMLEISVTDDGVGMDATRKPASGGLGLRIMEYRAHSVGGLISFESVSPGTRVVLRIPVSLLTASGGITNGDPPNPRPAHHSS